MATFKASNRKLKTPSKFVKLGKAFTAVSGTNLLAGMIAYINVEDEKVKKVLLIITGTLAGLGAIGSFLTTFFAEDEVQEIPPLN